MDDGRAVLATLLRHEAKSNSYKFALVRALNDLALLYPGPSGQRVIVPLRLVAERWLVSYWAFVGNAPVYQGPRARRAVGTVQDLSFREALTALRGAWEEWTGTCSGPADGALLLAAFQVGRGSLPEPLRRLTQATISAIAQAVRQPVRYAGTGNAHALFGAPAPAGTLSGHPLPGTRPAEPAFVVPAALWQTCRDLSLWVEALCLHEWSLYVERVTQDVPVSRGQVFTLLTSSPVARIPLTWERHQVQLLMLEGAVFHCPWTHKSLTPQGFDLDHLIPLSAHPLNDLWNLVPSDPVHNQRVKRARLPDSARLHSALQALEQTYRLYGQQSSTGPVLRRDVLARFGVPLAAGALAQQVCGLVDHVAEARNVPRY
ncbi:HNH endonuclease signature motif containing protein [Deinococcus aerophilus]|uniref:HNH nuclease domain-containing protein n=1 Tax=Deinococcus aerophilus TaxID=522488 RepID=A0ABQ2GWE4_9DEIO|nr:HNH endonuclease signature motif containing protein [Deinococcus aerophilus]GGM16709.1 hypothetical protein GCM10010841_26290 [Deinococcus aerophilus]